MIFLINLIGTIAYVLSMGCLFILVPVLLIALMKAGV